MSNFGFGFASFLQLGNGTVDIVIPGVFSGIVPNDPSNAGRFLKSVMIWSANSVDGDQISSLTIEDTDGVIPVPARAALPNYPVVFDLLDTATGASKALMIPPNGVTPEAFDQDGAQSIRFLPAQLHLKMTFAVGGANIGRTFRGLIRWGFWQ